jgi:hypothetical protein
VLASHVSYSKGLVSNFCRSSNLIAEYNRKFRFCRYLSVEDVAMVKLVCGSKVLTSMSSDHRSGQRSTVLHHTGHQSFGIVQASVILMNAQMFGHWDALSLR